MIPCLCRSKYRITFQNIFIVIVCYKNLATVEISSQQLRSNVHPNVKILSTPEKYVDNCCLAVTSRNILDQIFISLTFWCETEGTKSVGVLILRLVCSRLIGYIEEGCGFSLIYWINATRRAFAPKTSRTWGIRRVYRHCNKHRNNWKLKQNF